MKKLNPLSLAVATLALLIAQTSMASPLDNTVHIKNVIIGGSACPIGSISKVISSNRQAMSVLFDHAVANPGIRVCTLKVLVHVPNGTQSSQIRATYEGFSKGTSKLRRRYFFPNPTPLANTVNTFVVPPAGQDYVKVDLVSLASSNNAYCGQDLWFRLKVRIKANAGNYIAVDSLALQVDNTNFITPPLGCP